MQATETPLSSMTPEADSMTTHADETPSTKRRRPLLLALGLLLVAGVVAAVVLLTSGDDADQLTLGEPRIVSAGELSSYAGSANRPVYWADAPAQGFKLELTEVKGQRVFVRYLTADAKAGDPRPAFTTVATYPMKDAQARLESFEDRPGSVEGEGANGAITLHYRKAPSNVYVAPPNSDYVIEVYAPEPSAAQQLAKSATLSAVK